MDYRLAYEQWLSSHAIDDATRAELMAIGGDEKEIEERFYRELEFGTAGLRGILGAGLNRMNEYVVRRATQGLADYLSAIDGAKERGVCIAYDSRILSDVFARETAAVLAANGIRTYLFSALHSVPQLSAALQYHNCISGVVITASHNPKEYNGYKVYWAYGGQVTPAQAEDIFRCIQRVPMFGERTVDFEQAVAEGAIRLIGAEEDEAYYAATARLCLCPAAVRAHGKELKLVYTPLHGTGNVPVTTLLQRIGVTNVTVVPAQAAPDGSFPTVTAPNPEDPNAFKLSIALAEQIGATVCLATDPDADRLGIAVKTGAGNWVTLTGNQIGCILLEHILSNKKRQDRLPDNGVVIKSIVSTRLADAICRAYGATMENVMTGFRYIGEKIDAHATSGEKTFLFGFEESFGYLAGGPARDKDAISAAMLAAEACVLCKVQGKTLYDMLNDIYARYGVYKEKVKSYTRAGKAGMEQIAGCMAGLRRHAPAAVCGTDVTVLEDYLTSVRIRKDGSGPDTLTLPKSDVLRLELADESWIVVRPSGTEPKLKLYIGAVADSEQAVDAKLEGLFADMDARIEGLLGAAATQDS